LTILSKPQPGVAAGIAVVGDAANATGLALGNGKLLLWRREKGDQKIVVEVDAGEAGRQRLKVTATGGNRFRFSASPDGKHWTNVGDEQSGDRLPPWDRSIRVGLTVGGTTNGAAVFERFEMSASSTRN
jgi:hypothetical protein